MKYFKNIHYNYFTLIIIYSFILCTAYAKLNLKNKFLRQTQANETNVLLQKAIKTDVRKTMTLQFFKNNTKTLETPISFNANALANSGCSPTDKFAIILHGWIQSCSEDWALALIERLSFYRGGCVICIDYSTVAKSSYMKLYSKFEDISKAIVSSILSLFQYGFDPSRGYMFGFSFGGQLASAVGRLLQPDFSLNNIDTCDMAGPGFDPILVDHSKAGEHVQCFHTSRDKGTFIHSCHRNILLGSCGLSQPSVASQYHLGSHGLCVEIYINAFDYPFYALKSPPSECMSLTPAAQVPDEYTVGYEENFNNQVIGKVYVPTSLHYPYNLSKRELRLISKNNNV